MTTQKLYTPNEIAMILSLDVMTIYRYIKTKKLTAIKIGKQQYRISQDSLDIFLKGK